MVGQSLLQLTDCDPRRLPDGLPVGRRWLIARRLT